MMQIQSQRETFAYRVAAFNPIQENFGPHYQPGKDPKIDAAANAYALWAGRLDDRNEPELSKNLVDAVHASGIPTESTGNLSWNPQDAWDMSSALQNHLRRPH
jgi:hypothetical protein